MAAKILHNLPLDLNVSTSMITDHPYYPLQVEIAAYLANEWSVPLLLGIFFGGLAVILLGTKAFVARAHPNLRASERAAIWWFVLCMYLLLFFSLQLGGEIERVNWRGLDRIGIGIGNWKAN